MTLDLVTDRELAQLRQNVAELSAEVDALRSLMRAVDARCVEYREALVEAVRRAGLPVTPKVNGLPSSEAECAAAIERCVRLALDHVADPARRALSGSPTPTTETEKEK